MIVNFKLFENSDVFNYDVDFKVGDYVYLMKMNNNMVGSFLKFDTKYKIIKIYSNFGVIRSLLSRKESSTDPEDFCDIEDENGKTYDCFWLKRFMSEVEYNAKQYNL